MTAATETASSAEAEACRRSHTCQTQVQEYMDAGKCFGCGLKMSEPNYSNKCPNGKLDANGRVSWGK